MDIVAALTGYTQHARHLQLDSALPAGTVVVERFHGREAVSESFRFEIDVLSREPYLYLEPLLGTPARLRMSTDAAPPAAGTATSPPPPSPARCPPEVPLGTAHPCIARRRYPQCGLIDLQLALRDHEES